TATIRHLCYAISVLGIPQEIKTDNGPNYVSSRVREFLNKWGISHITGIPYNSTGQAILERAHQT
ncbi:POK19 protein, partial [Spizaetus tyrannus]|nr:POK19 protein [Spizaetus tyrannus]